MRLHRVRQLVFIAAMLLGVLISVGVAREWWNWHPPRSVEPIRHEGQRK